MFKEVFKFLKGSLSLLDPTRLVIPAFHLSEAIKFFMKRGAVIRGEVGVMTEVAPAISIIELLAFGTGD